MTGFGVDLAAMAQTIKGINDAVAALNDAAPLGGHLTSASAEFAFLCPSESDCGDEVLGDAFDEFSERWRWGVRHLVKEGTELVTALTDTKSVYEKAEDKVKQAFQLLVGDPRSNVDASTKSWDELAKPLMEQPSMGKEWDKATKGLSDSWNSVTKDVTGVVDDANRRGTDIGKKIGEHL